MIHCMLVMGARSFYIHISVKPINHPRKEVEYNHFTDVDIET